MPKKFIKDLKSGDTVAGYFGILQKAQKITRQDKPYLDLILVDKSGRISAKMWDNVEQVTDDIVEGRAVAVKGRVDTYNEQLQLVVKDIRLVDEERDKAFGFSFDDIIQTTQKDIAAMWRNIRQAIDSIQNSYLKQVVDNIFTKYAAKIKIFPASMILHHSYRGGLLEHLQAMVTHGETLCKIYTQADRDLVITGVLLHDIGKLNELEPGITTNYTDAGNFIGHLVLGRDIFLHAAAEIEDFPEELKYKIEHIILSHQGRMEWASPKEPQFLEALLVYYIDEMDTRINQLQRAIESDESEGNWTTKKNYFKRPLYKGNKKTEG